MYYYYIGQKESEKEMTLEGDDLEKQCKTFPLHSLASEESKIQSRCDGCSHLKVGVVGKCTNTKLSGAGALFSCQLAGCVGLLERLPV